MPRLLVTGGRGFIGRHCLAPALDAGFEVHATLLPGESGTDTDLPNGVVWHGCDLLVPGAAEALLAELRPTHMLHTAWETGHGSYWTAPSNLDWLGATTRILPVFVRHGGTRFVTAGSCAEYDWSGTGTMVEDETPDRPYSFYGRIKLAHHQVMMAAAEQLGFAAATGRVFFGYGPHENAQRIIPYACRQLAAGQPALFSSGTQIRDFMHVEDIGRGFVALLDSDLNGIVNIASGKGVALADIVTRLGAIAGRPDLIRLGARPDRPDDVPRLVADTARLRSTGWNSGIPLNEGLAQSYAWWQVH